MAASRRDSRERRDAASTVRGVSPVRVLLVDDHQMLTEALAARLSTTPDIVVAGHCAARDPHPEVLVTAARPDVIAIEVTLARDATPLLALFRTAWPPAHFVVLTASRDPEQAVETARAGAVGMGIEGVLDRHPHLRPGLRQPRVRVLSFRAARPCAAGAASRRRSGATPRRTAGLTDLP